KIDRTIASLSPAVIEALRRSSEAFNFSTLARFDFRWRKTIIDSRSIELEDLWFLEINCMPTLRTDVNFLKSVTSYIGAASGRLIDYVNRAKKLDISALAYLLLQFYLASSHDQIKK